MKSKIQNVIKQRGELDDRMDKIFGTGRPSDETLELEKELEELVVLRDKKMSS